MTAFTAETTEASRKKFADELDAAFGQGGALEDRDHLYDSLTLFVSMGDRCAEREDHAGAFLGYGNGWVMLQDFLKEQAEMDALAARAQDALEEAQVADF